MRQRLEWTLRRLSSLKGFTMVEMLASSLIAAVVTGGTFMAFVTAARIHRIANTPSLVEATILAQETLERHRNEVFVGSTLFSRNTWQSENPTSNGGSESILTMNGVQAKRCYRVIPEDCDGIGGTGDCYAVQVKVCWNDLTGCPSCP